MSLSRISMSLALRNNVFRKKLLKAFSKYARAKSPSFIDKYYEVLAQEIREIQLVEKEGFESAREYESPQEALKIFQRDWKPRKLSNFSYFSSLIENGLQKLNNYGLEIEEVESFPLDNGIESLIIIVGESYSIDPEDPYSMIESPRSQDDFTNEIETLIRKRLKPSRIEIPSARIRTSQYEDLQEVFWKIKVTWDFDFFEISFPEKLKEYFLQSFNKARQKGHRP